ncbi:MAG: maleylpyruvate isomerase family mycothiol-dependent enzyme, partial [Acidimicrobiales bacterium]
RRSGHLADGYPPRSRTYGEEMDWIAAVERAGQTLSLAARHDTTAEVLSCPGWNIDELLRHVGIAHHRVALIIREGRTEPPPLEETIPPHGGSLSWYEAGLATLLDAMRTVDPATPVWTFSRSDKTATFWHRRMAHETTVHRVDAEQATGTVGPVEPELALDGIAESLEVFAPLTARREKDPSTATVHLHASDVEGEWLVTLGGGTIAVEHGHAKGDAAVRGTAADLYLWLWGRAGLDRIEVFGDAAHAERLTKLSRV